MKGTAETTKIESDNHTGLPTEARNISGKADKGLGIVIARRNDVAASVRNGISQRLNPKRSDRNNSYPHPLTHRHDAPSAPINIVGHVEVPVLDNAVILKAVHPPAALRQPNHNPLC
jgi:hypothetical protein